MLPGCNELKFKLVLPSEHLGVRAIEYDALTMVLRCVTSANQGRCWDQSR